MATLSSRFLTQASAFAFAAFAAVTTVATPHLTTVAPNVNHAIATAAGVTAKTATVSHGQSSSQDSVGSLVQHHYP